MEVILQQFANLSVLIYIFTTMLSMGHNFLLKQFLEPLKDKSLILKSLAANFVVSFNSFGNNFKFKFDALLFHILYFIYFVFFGFLCLHTLFQLNYELIFILENS